jgi:hypothetical protein
MPVRLVQENGETISLDATSIDIVVERQISNFGIPFFDAKKLGIDLNQAAVAVEVQGVLADDVGQEETSSATALIDFYQPQQLFTPRPDSGGGGGMTGGQMPSAFNTQGAMGVSAIGSTGLGSGGGFSGGFGGGFGGGLGGHPTSSGDLGNRILQHWSKRYIDLPLAYWVEEATALDNPVKTGLQLWLKPENIVGNPNTSVETWNDASGNGRHATQSTAGLRPFHRTASTGGLAEVVFNGSDRLDIPYSAFLNSEEFSIFVIARNFSTGVKPILKTASNGYSLSFDQGNTRVVAGWDESGSADTQASSAGSSRSYSTQLLCYTMDDTTGNAQADTVKIYSRGEEVGSKTSGVDYTPATSGTLYIGHDTSTSLNGAVQEILIYNKVVTTDERNQIEGYLARKYGLHLLEGKYEGLAQYSYDHKHLRVGFDKELIGSVKEPHGFLNQRRKTNMVLGSISSGAAVLPVIGGDPREWFELTENNRNMRIVFKENDDAASYRKTSGGQEYFGTVTAVTSNQITVNLSQGSATHAIGDQVWIEPFDYGDASGLNGNDLSPVLIIPVKNADTFEEGALPNKAVGPEFPAHQNGDARDTGGGLDRTDEYIAYLFSKAITSDYITLGKAVNAAGNLTLDKAFTTAISQSSSGHNSRLTITQSHATSLGKLSDKINTNLGVGQAPIIDGFTGGKSGKRVKSGGDKAQDLIGILANSNNFLNFIPSNRIAKVIDVASGFVQDTFYNSPDAQGDYIRGIQIPYNSLATKGKSNLDTEVAQRNFFLTTEGNTSDKLSSVNSIHASRLFSNTAEGHFKNGISGIVTDFVTHREAEMKAYEFSLKFIAADIIM